MILDEQIIQARYARLGSATVVVTAPGNLKIQTTGPGAGSVFDDGPMAGKQWAVTIRLEITETDVP